MPRHGSHLSRRQRSDPLTRDSSHSMGLFRRILSYLAAGVIGAFIALFAIYIAIASNLPELRSWHEALAVSDFGPDDYGRDFAHFLAVEERLFQSLDAMVDIYYAETSGGRRRGTPGHTFIYKRTAGAGATVDIGVYNMHNALYVMGYPRPTHVSAITTDCISRQDPGLDDMDVEEFGAAWVRFENGAAMVFKISWAMHQDSLGGKPGHPGL